METSKKSILFIPAWWPCSFFNEQQEVYAERYDIYQFHGKCIQLSRKTSLKHPFQESVSIQSINEKMLEGSIYWHKKRTNEALESRFHQIADKVGKGIIEQMHGQKPDFIYLQSVSELATFVADWATRNGIKIVLSEHILYVRHGIDFLTHKKEWVYSIADSVFCVSNYLYRNLLTSGFQMRNVRVIGNMINSHAVPDEWNKLTKNGKIIFVASHTSDKDITTLIDVAQRLESSRIAIDVYGLTGEEVLTNGKSIAEQISERNIGDTISCKGVVSHQKLLEKYAEYSLLLSTSISETFGLAVAEAIAHGTPVVCTDSGGIHDFINERNGIIVPIRDTNKIVEAIHCSYNRTYDYTEMSKEILSKFGEPTYKANTTLE